MRKEDLKMTINWTGFVIFFLLWLSCFLPICDGIEKKFKLNKILASILATIISITPFANFGFALWGAINGWRWKWWQATIYTLIILSIYLVIAASGIKAFSISYY